MRPALLSTCACVLAFGGAGHAAAEEPAAPAEAQAESPEATAATPAPTSTEPEPAPVPDAGPAAAETMKPSGLTLGARLSLALPAGTTAGTVGGGYDPQYDTVTFAFPLWLEAGYRFARHYVIGGYGVFGLSTVPNTCPTAICYDLRFGVDAQYHGRGVKTDPWVGVGFGYEILHAGSSNATMAWRGWELLSLQGGIDWHVAKAFDLGPFMAVSFGEYTSLREISRGVDTSTSISNKALHEWLELGMRGEYDL